MSRVGLPDHVVSVADLAQGLGTPWQPVDVARSNDAILRLTRLEGSFAWHAHDEDELFLCWSGRFRIELDGADPVEILPSKVFVVVAGTRHRPVADAGPAYALLLERPETLQYGNDQPGEG